MPSIEVTRINTLAHLIQERSEDPDLRCCYPSKLCNNPRVIKRNGELHRFCEAHRKRANENQRRQDEKRKQRALAQKRQMEASAPSQITYDQEKFDSVISPLGLDEADLRVLEAFLFDFDIDFDNSTDPLCFNKSV
uniref:Uncharacterized protein n=1 Tax=Globisporangium ultimum (strain ATCC 200006 / CBS 805.95 / DAOM BR144) TaxID=431595 RepID=K3W7N1_GLOUD